MKKYIDEFLASFPTMTQDVSDLIYTVLKWPDEKKTAFLLAKQMFEENLTGQEHET